MGGCASRHCVGSAAFVAGGRCVHPADLARRWAHARAVTCAVRCGVIPASQPVAIIPDPDRVVSRKRAPRLPGGSALSVYPFAMDIVKASTRSPMRTCRNAVSIPSTSPKRTRMSAVLGRPSVAVLMRCSLVFLMAMVRKAQTVLALLGRRSLNRQGAVAAQNR